VTMTNPDPATPHSALGILGGTFDPIHAGHLGVAEVVGRALGLERTLLVPAHTPPHRAAPLVSVYHRFAMVALAAMTAKSLAASDLDLVDAGPSYTAVLLDRLLAEGHRGSRMVFITGADAFAEIATWHDYPAVLDRCHFAVVSRPGIPAADLPERLPDLTGRFMTVPPSARGADTSLPFLPAAPHVFLIEARTPDVSSTEIRARLRAGGPLTDVMPETVAEYATRHGLYLDA
jgi:nicotinate-nucleotide adenylyltransferase